MQAGEQLWSSLALANQRLVGRRVAERTEISSGNGRDRQQRGARGGRGFRVYDYIRLKVEGFGPQCLQKLF